MDYNAIAGNKVILEDVSALETAYNNLLEMRKTACEQFLIVIRRLLRRQDPAFKWFWWFKISNKKLGDRWRSLNDQDLLQEILRSDGFYLGKYFISRRRYSDHGKNYDFSVYNSLRELIAMKNNTKVYLLNQEMMKEVIYWQNYDVTKISWTKHWLSRLKREPVYIFGEEW